VTLKPLLNRLLKLGSTNPYHPYNGSAMPLRQRAVHINLRPHPDEIWTGPRAIGEGYSFELGNISSCSVGTQMGPHIEVPSPATSRPDFFHYYLEDDLKWENLTTEEITLEFPSPPPVKPPPAIPRRSSRRVHIAPLFSHPPDPDLEEGGNQGGIVRTTEFKVSATMRKDKRGRQQQQDGKWF